MVKPWWLGFPSIRCPHCGKKIEGIKFQGRFKLPRVAKEVTPPDDSAVHKNTDDSSPR